MNAPFFPPVYTRTARPGGDGDALIRRHLPLVRRIAWHVHGHMSSMIDVEDLVQVGLVALVEAVPMFEDRGQVTFEQYLATRLRGAMIDELRRQATISRGAMKRRRDYAKAVAALTHELGRAPLPAEIADRLGVPIGRLRQDYADVQALQFDSIDELYSDEAPWFMDDGPDAFEAMAEGELRTALIEAITALPEREALVIQLYYVEELNLEEIGQVLGVGSARICQIKKAAHERLRKALARQG
ncbi:RNA polymerase sigma factor FliA [Sphingomonas sp. CFBP 13720]|uniref:RNA polymerase sigma factor FliA n=1 Tax=Sphingomonas sp. CFBP 13720 TaxID=2775302 RepID=UPI00178670B0|nr:RNA polymerase sigma factor FliA [Sphingomonas sp. CFBP 13720]MBD8677840.1 RNA polymerase sigma factor FliA [Sphingomonas sp. CFBP 13720]